LLDLADLVSLSVLPAYFSEPAAEYLRVIDEEEAWVVWNPNSAKRLS